MLLSQGSGEHKSNTDKEQSAHKSNGSVTIYPEVVTKLYVAMANNNFSGLWSESDTSKHFPDNNSVCKS